MSARTSALRIVASAALLALAQGCASAGGGAGATAPNGTTGGRGAPAAGTTSEAVAPTLILARGEALLATKQRLAAGDATLRPAFDALILAADSAMTAGPWSVMQKKKVPPSGDKHDFMSLAPYWWPDSTKGVSFW
ncbi:MAG: hypothetical protein ACJ79K_11465 [Gemmatimonadaceae bacterium]